MNIIVLEQAEKIIDNLEKQDKKRILKAIANIPNGDIKFIKNSGNRYRVRGGNYRAFYFKDGDNYVVYNVLKRNEKTYKMR